MIDQTGRAKLMNRQNNGQLNQGLASVADAIKSNDGNAQLVRDLITELVNLNGKFESEMIDKLKVLNDAFAKNSLTTEQLQNLKTLIDTVNAKMAVFEEIKGKIDMGQTIVFPKETQLSGEVSVTEVKKLPLVELKNPPVFPEIHIPEPIPFPESFKVSALPPVIIKNIAELISKIEELQIGTVKAVQALQTKFPESFKISDEVKITDMDLLLEDMDELKKGFNLLLQKDFGNPANGPMQVEVVKEPVRMTPQPVTNININGLQGFGKSTAQTLSTARSQIPGYGQLFGRRSLIIFNNSSATIYIGGSDVTSTNGLPVLTQSYSPAIDAGYNLVVYGLTASSTADIRVFEVSKDQSDNVQE